MSYDLLDGVKVVELSLYAFAPSAAAVLADWGADVVKIVPPTVADPMRGSPIARLPERDVGVEFMWEILNRGKRCAGVDVSHPDGQQVVHDLVARADVFITNLLPDARRRFRVDVDDLHAVNPRLIYARATGHGTDGPERDRGGYDITDFWARSGIGHAASQVSDEFVPLLGPAFGDLTSGTFLAGGIAAALFRRERAGRGAVIDVSLLGSGVWVLSPGIVASRLYDIDTIPRFRHADAPNPLVAVYTTSDGRQIYLSGIQTERHFENFCEVVERLDLLDDPRFASGTARLEHAPECVRVIDEIFAARTLAEWCAVLPALTTPWMVVQTAAEASRDAQVVANGFVVDVEGADEPFALVASPVQVDGAPLTLTRAPDHGEQTEAVLLELGRTWDEIAALKASGAVL